MTDDGVSSSDAILRPEEEVIGEYIRNSEDLIHIFGEPGVGKTTVLDHIENKFEEDLDIDRRNIKANHNIEEIFRKTSRAIFDRLSDEKKEENHRLSGFSLSTPIVGAGVSTETTEAEVSRAQFEYRDSLETVSELFPDDQTVVICVDDVHELDDDKRKTQDAIQETAEILPSNVTLITAGRLSWRDLNTGVSLSMFTEDQTDTFLQNVFTDVTPEETRTIHNRLSGHPLYIGLLAESNEESDLPAIPEGEVHKEIEERYLEFLNRDERRLLLATAPLDELNEEICTRVASRVYDFDRITVADILESLNTRTVVQTLGHNADGLQTFKVHDVFRDFLQTRSDHEKTARTGACIYHAEKLSQFASESCTFETEVDHVTSWASHLLNETIHEEQETLVELIEATVADDGLRFYPSSLIIDEFKTRKADELPDMVVTSLLSSVDDSCNLSNYFYDVDLDSSWADLLFEQGAFTDPDSNLLSYLGRTAETRPSFVRQVVEEIDTDDLRTLRYLISVARDLPVEDAAVVGQYAAIWIQGDEAYDLLATHALSLASYLIENEEYDDSLDILDNVVTPQGRAQLDVDQGMIRYNLISILDDHFDELLQERPEELIDVFYSNLIDELEQQSDEEDDYGTVAEGTSFADLRYVKEDRGTLAEILLDYFVRAVSTWVAENPTIDQRREFVKELLSSPTVFRRTGFYILSECPNAFEDLLQEELTRKENYREQQSQYEFHLALEAGFEHLNDSSQQRVCEIIEEGPYTDEIEDRAALMAERGNESASYFEQRIRETWKRDRFSLISDNLEEPYTARLEDLVEKYEEPDRLPSRTRRPEVSSGIVHQRGPTETEKLREQSAEEVLTTAVEWEPPESERWETRDDDQFEERNYVGFSRQLEKLIKENPQRYAREISVLEDANTRYAGAAFRAFNDLIDDGETFRWESILELGQTITTSPTAWSGHTRTNLARLINQGIAADETDFPNGAESQVEEILLTLIDDPDPDPERDQPPEGTAGHGDPAHVAINSTRPMAMNAYLTYLLWKDEQTENQLEQMFFEPVKEHIRTDPSLAVRSVIGRRFGTLYTLDEKLVEDHLEDIFPREKNQTARQRFIAAWNSYTRHNRYWDNDDFRQYHRYALGLIDTNEDQTYEIEIQPTTAHIASIYLFEDEKITDEDSLVRQFYNVTDQNEARALASILASSMENEGVENQWTKIRKLWNWRLDNLTLEDERSDIEIWHFLDCVRKADTITLKDEKSNIIQSLPFVASHARHWRHIEDWFADQVSSDPIITIALYEELVEAVPCDERSSLSRTSQEDNRMCLYRNAEAAGNESLQIALDIADQFAAENNNMDKEFLESHLSI